MKNYICTKHFIDGEQSKASIGGYAMFGGQHPIGSVVSDKDIQILLGIEEHGDGNYVDNNGLHWHCLAEFEEIDYGLGELKKLLDEATAQLISLINGRVILR